MKPKETNMEKSKQIVLDFFNEQKKFKKAQAKFEELKTRFYSEMEKLFKVKPIDDKTIVFADGFSDDNLEVNRVQKSSVIFDADKLEKKLSKEISRDVIVRKYEIIDMAGLITYLKECNVDPKVFKSFLSITKSVDVKELERLEELGKLTAEQLKGCYTIKKQKPYFTVGLKKMAR